MKKTIVIIILVIYIASIAVVNFFGLETKQFDGTTPVESIICNRVLLQNEKGDDAGLPISTYRGPNKDIPLYVFEFTENPDGSEYTNDPESIDSNPNVIWIDYEVLPHLADDKSVKFEYYESAGVVHFVEERQFFVFLIPDTIINITIRSADGSNKSTTISLKGSTTIN